MSLAAHHLAVQDGAGNALANVEIEVRAAITGTPLVSLFADRDGAAALGNPFTAADGGHVSFYVEGGLYNILATKDGDEREWEDVPIGTAQGLDIEDVLTGKRVQVRAATTANITISTALNNGDTIDGVVLATGDLVLVKDQATKAQNGIYVVGAVPARSVDFDAWEEHIGALVFVASGTVGANSAWASSANSGGTLGTTDINFTKIAMNPTAAATPPRIVTAAGAVAVTTTDEVVLINKTVGAATAVSLPSAASFLAQPGKTNYLLVIKDMKGDAEANNITITPNGAETIDGQATEVIASNLGGVALRPVSGTGWVRT